MDHLVAIFAPEADHHADARILAELAPHRPTRVTVLIAGPAVTIAADGPEADAARDRLAWLMTAIELATGGAVSGLVGEPDDLDAPSDRVIGGRSALAAV